VIPVNSPCAGTVDHLKPQDFLLKERNINDMVKRREPSVSERGRIPVSEPSCPVTERIGTAFSVRRNV